MADDKVATGDGVPSSPSLLSRSVEEGRNPPEPPLFKLKGEGWGWQITILPPPPSFSFKGNNVILLDFFSFRMNRLRADFTDVT